MKTIRYASDLHVALNKECFGISEDYIIEQLNLEGIDILVLAGDTDEYPRNLTFCEKIMNLYPNLKIIEVAGNHLYYSCRYRLLNISDIDNKCRLFTKEHENYYFLNNNSVIIDNIKFIGSTMWTKLGEHAGIQMKIVNTSNDFNYIMNDKLEYISATDIVKLHEKSIKYIKKEINNCDSEHCIVVTHHAPFFEYHSDISHAFSIDLDSQLKRLKKYPDYWIFGHTHVNSGKVLEYKNGKINCLCNQFGYKGESEYSPVFNAWTTYDKNKCIEVV